MQRLFSALIVLLCSTAVMAGGHTPGERIAKAMSGEHRSETNIARNMYRHPAETLEFFGLEDGMTVMEIWPGGGWYTEILAPAIRDHGKFVIATWDPAVEGQSEYRYTLPEKMKETFAKYPEVYDQVETVYYSPPESASLGDAESMDMVLTFRNTHGWANAGMAQDIYNEFARILKPGGVLGVVQHRAAPGTSLEDALKGGYVPEEDVKAFATNAGLVFEESSEINANPKDTRDHPKGVWTLPPTLRLKDVDKEKYLAIGESDRMTLRFRKPR